MKPVKIGVVPTLPLATTEDIFDRNRNQFNSLYSNKIYESGGVPFGILTNNNDIDTSVLDFFDGFLIQGGNKVYDYIFKILLYAIKNNKPVLGVCLGSEAIAIFSAILEKIDINKDYSLNNIYEIYRDLKEKYDGSLLKYLGDKTIHGDINRHIINENNLNDAVHSININNNSLLYEIYNNNKLDVVSLHCYDYKYIGNDFEVVAKADDGVCEAIEYKDKKHFILGTHFHPELFEDNLIFERFIIEAKNRIK